MLTFLSLPLRSLPGCWRRDSFNPGGIMHFSRGCARPGQLFVHSKIWWTEFRGTANKQRVSASVALDDLSTFC